MQFVTARLEMLLHALEWNLLFKSQNMFHTYCTEIMVLHTPLRIYYLKRRHFIVIYSVRSTCYTAVRINNFLKELLQSK